MIFDFESLDAPQDLASDVCIIGAGAAGITLALELERRGIQVCLVESGGFEFSSDTQWLYDAQVTGVKDPSPGGCRLRFFGGTTNHWSGWCQPLHDTDFESRAWVPHSGWPINRADLDAAYHQAQRYCQIGDFDFSDTARLASRRGLPRLSDEKARLGFFRFSPPTRFGELYRDELRRSTSATVMIHANVTRLHVGEEANSVRSIGFRTLSGREGTVTARAFVLACGGMENARVLLLSTHGGKMGLGDDYGMVGRFFAQHVEGVVAQILAVDPASLQERFDYFRFGRTVTRADIQISPQAQQRRRILNCGFTIHRNENRVSRLGEIRSLLGEIRRGERPSDLSPRLWTLLRGMEKAATVETSDEVIMPSLYVRAETEPNPESRLTLSEEMDAFGLPKLRVHWQLTELDRFSILESTKIVAEELGRLGLARIRLVDWLAAEDGGWPDEVWGAVTTWALRE